MPTIVGISINAILGVNKDDVCGGHIDLRTLGNAVSILVTYLHIDLDGC